MKTRGHHACSGLRGVKKQNPMLALGGGMCRAPCLLKVAGCEDTGPHGCSRWQGMQSPMVALGGWVCRAPCLLGVAGREDTGPHACSGWRDVKTQGPDACSGCEDKGLHACSGCEDKGPHACSGWQGNGHWFEIVFFFHLKCVVMSSV